jgi:hypothetical protein
MTKILEQKLENFVKTDINFLIVTCSPYTFNTSKRIKRTFEKEDKMSIKIDNGRTLSSFLFNGSFNNFEYNNIFIGPVGFEQYVAQPDSNIMTYEDMTSHYVNFGCNNINAIAENEYEIMLEEIITYSVFCTEVVNVYYDINNKILEKIISNAKSKKETGHSIRFISRNTTREN